MYILLLIILAIKGSFIPNEVYQIRRGTHSKLVVKKGDLVDSINYCHFGQTPEFELLKH